MLPFLLCFTLYLRPISKYKAPGADIRRGDLTEGFFTLCAWSGLLSESYGKSCKAQKRIAKLLQSLSYLNFLSLTD